MKCPNCLANGKGKIIMDEFDNHFECANCGYQYFKNMKNQNG